MPSESQIEQQFWDALREDMVVMIGLADGTAELRPMTVRMEMDRGPLWLFTFTDSGLMENLAGGAPAVASFTAKKHTLFARIEGTLHRDSDMATIDRLWNRDVAAWYEGGKEDPKLALLRFDAERLEIWRNETSLFAGVRLLIGGDPKEVYKASVAHITLRAAEGDPGAR